ncbi:hypothetical protein OAS19_00365 [Altererythrobacter sp.]|nr:hypothetical protein [Altererythrobacter sp.]
MAFPPGESAQTANHLDSPWRTSPSADSTPDRAADIADVFAWADDGNLNVILTFAAPAEASEPATYDRDVLYKVNIPTDGDPLNTENVICFRFGQAGANAFGIQQNAPRQYSLVERQHCTRSLSRRASFAVQFHDVAGSCPCQSDAR